MAIAKARGARVIAIDGVDLRLREARRSAPTRRSISASMPTSSRATSVCASCANGWPDVVLEVAGVPDAFLDALKMVRIGGRVIEVGNISSGLTVQRRPL